MAFFDVIAVTPNSPIVAERLVPGSSAPAGPAPTITWSAPTPGSTIGPDDDLAVTITDDDLVELTLLAKYPDLGVWDVIYHGGTFAAKYAGSEYALIGSDHTFTLRRVGGWLGRVVIGVIAVDGNGQVGSV